MHGNNSKIYILGASGFLGGRCAKFFQEKGYKVLKGRIDITDFKNLRDKFKDLKPDVVINFAGVRAYPNIDWCEDNKEETVKVNVCGAINAMLAALDACAFPIQIASGCIYSGGPGKEFIEEDEQKMSRTFSAVFIQERELRCKWLSGSCLFCRPESGCLFHTAPIQET